MKKPDNLEKLFKEKLGKLEVDPGANAWANIKIGLGSTATGVSTSKGLFSTSSWSSFTIVGAVVTTIALGGYFLLHNQEKTQHKHTIKEVNKDSSRASISPQPLTLPVTSTKEAGKQVNQEQANQPTVLSKEVSENTRYEDNNQTNQTPLPQLETYEKTIEEIIAESQKQFEANQQEAIRLEKEQQATSSPENDPLLSSPELLPQTSNEEVNPKEDLGSSEKVENERYNLADEIEFPNIFSPNLDGSNDVYRLSIKYHHLLDNMVVYIYSNTNKVIYEWAGLNGNWDGRLRNGSPAPEGVYFYRAILAKDGENYTKAGQLFLKR